MCATVAESEDVWIPTRELAALLGVSHSAAKGHGQRGNFDAQKIGRGYVFRLALASEYKRRAPARGKVVLPCAGGCGRKVTRYVSELERSRSGRAYCPECWATAGPELRREGLERAERPVRKPGQSATMRRLWSEGRFDREEHARRTGSVIAAINRSPKRFVDRVERLRAGRGLAPLSAARKRELAKLASQRGQADTTQVKGREELDQWIVEAWPDPRMTVPKMAQQFGVSERHIRRRARDLDLSPRIGGRPKRLS